MPMSRQDYVAFAEIVRDLSRLYPNGGVNSESVAARMAELFADDNERFDAVRCFDACGINGKLAPFSRPVCRCACGVCVVCLLYGAVEPTSKRAPPRLFRSGTSELAADPEGMRIRCP